MMSCRDVARLRDRFLALELEPQVEDSYRQHLRECSPCRLAADAHEPILALARMLSDVPAGEDPTFVAEVLGGVHQRSLERRLKRRRGWMAAAAAVVVAFVAGLFALTGRDASAPVPGMARVASNHAASEPAFVEVEGSDVRVYQLAGTPPENVQVAFIVDPHLEL
jgi:hypothetical protein